MEPGSASLVVTAQRCRDRSGAGDDWPPAHVSLWSRLELEIDERFCRDVADRFDALPARHDDVRLACRYDALKRETRRLYDAILDAGITVEPWQRPGQPYRDARAMAADVAATGTLQLFLTVHGHGPAGDAGDHPLRDGSGVRANGVEFTHNDLLRAAHDVFGHVLGGHDFGVAGELKAAYCHMALYSDTARPVVFAEQVAQTCWFFFGAHLRDARGRVRRPGDQGYLPPRRRPYPAQKVFAAEPGELGAFRRLFRLEERA
jgi:hypothetical protein